MKKPQITPNTIRILCFILGILVFGGCKHDGENTKINDYDASIQNATIEKNLLVGSWKDTSAAALDFTLFESATARSDNMQTLAYKRWSVDGNLLTITLESIGNGTSFVGNQVYTIEKLTESEMVLSDGEYVMVYRKK